MMEAKLLQQINSAGEKRIHRIYFLRTAWRWAAASIIFAVGIGSYFLFFNKAVKRIEVSKTVVPNDVKAPENNKATIKTTDGQIIYLDSAANGTLMNQGNVSLVKLADGKIVYQKGDALTPLSVIYNTLTNPRGSRVIDMTFEDGSRIWLNAGSSVTYPVIFVGNERKISITGEAYFEVAHDAIKKFIVEANGIIVEDVGTAFNINAYNNEPVLKTTLVTGEINVIKYNVVKNLVPGQQAIIDKSGNISVIKNADVELAVAWKNGFTRFKSADLGIIMRQLERWYDIDVMFEAGISGRSFTGGLSSSSNLSEVLKILEFSNIHFKLEGRRLTVIP